MRPARHDARGEGSSVSTTLRHGLVALVILSLPLAPDAAAVAPARTKKRVVAVFEISAQNTAFPKAGIEALTTFLGARVAATGLYRVTPQESVRARLKAQKRASYKLCYRRSCQIEIGRELAADLALSTEIAKVGASCLLSMRLYNLKDEATDFAYAKPIVCDEGALGAALVAAVQALQAQRARGAMSRDAVGRPMGAPTAATTQVTVFLRSTPSAEVLIDDLRVGRTPTSVQLDPHKRYRLSLVREGYESHQRALSPKHTRRVEATLTLSAGGRAELAAASEWFVFGLGAAFLNGVSTPLSALSITPLGRVKWRRFGWSPIEFNFALNPGSQQSAQPPSRSTVLLMVGTRLAYPLYLGARGQHQLLFSVALGYLGVDDGVSRASDGTTSMTGYFGIAPGLTYLYNTFGGIMPVGLSLRGLLPLAGPAPEGAARPFGAIVCAELGFSLSRLVAELVEGARSNSSPAEAPPSALRTTKR